MNGNPREWAGLDFLGNAIRVIRYRRGKGTRCEYVLAFYHSIVVRPWKAGDLGADWSPRGECAGPTFMWTRPDTHHSNPQLWVNSNG